MERKKELGPQLKGLGFQPGISGNPKGRPKGTAVHSPMARAYKGVIKIAGENLPAVFANLLENALKGESWAHQLYYKEFITKKAREEVVLLDNRDSSIDGQIKALTDAISQFEEVTLCEAETRLKLLLDAKKVAEGDKDDNVTVIMKRDELMDKVDKLDLLIELKTNKEGKNE